MSSPTESLALAEKHLEKVLAAAGGPTDWLDLALYGFYCLENAVMAAALHLEVPIARSHPRRSPRRARCMQSMGCRRWWRCWSASTRPGKAVAYGDVDLPDLDAEDVATEVEAYVISVREVVAGGAE